MSLRIIGESAMAAVLAALILAVAAAFWQFVAAGGLIEALGGVTSSEIESMSPLPKGAVVAFDVSACPSGWEKFKDAGGRTIVGVKEDKEDPWVFRDRGGTASIMLTEAHMPLHKHKYEDVYYPEKESRMPSGAKAVEIPKKDSTHQGGWGHNTGGDDDHDNVGWALPDRETKEFGAAEGKQEELTNLQPYIVLSFCKRKEG